jgi:TetR/AcrR family transcriptional repressor of nem operon
MGRPRTFDEEQVVRRATELFWTKGYEATSIAELSAELGVHPGSLYRSFGNKEALFQRAVEHYRDHWAAGLGPYLCAGGPVLPRVRAVLVDFIEQAAGQQPPRGCLIANSIGELLPEGEASLTELLGGTLAVVEDGFLQGLRLAAEHGELANPGQLAAHAALLTMLLEGLQIRLKVEPDPRRLLPAVDSGLAALGLVKT